MITTITNFGDNLGVLFPKSLLKNIPIIENDDVELFVSNDSIVIKRVEKKKHRTTKERIANFCEIVNEVQFVEADWGKPQGKEIW